VIGVAIGLAVRGIARTVVDGGEEGRGGPLLGRRVRAWYRQCMAPLELGLLRAGVSADLLTAASLLVSAAAGWAFAVGAIFLAGWLTMLAGTLDVLDGGVARRSGQASRRGALIDSVIDRWAEFLTFAGLGVFFLQQPGMLAVVAVAAFAAQMVSYVRARAEGLGLALAVGRVQRPERYVVLGFGAWLSGLAAHVTCPLLGRPTHVILASAVVILAVLSVWTAIERSCWAASRLRQEDRGR